MSAPFWPSLMSGTDQNSGMTPTVISSNRDFFPAGGTGVADLSDRCNQTDSRMLLALFQDSAVLKDFNKTPFRFR